jgi:uncharacterized protein
MNRLTPTYSEATSRSYRVVGMLGAIICLAGLGAVAQTNPVINPAAAPFTLEDVRLLSGPFQDAMLRNKTYLLSLNADRFLHVFRSNYGLPAPGSPYGGWDSPTSEQRGCSLGHYLSACALMYASTGDAALKTQADYLVAELAKCQAAATNAGFNAGYLSAFPESFIDRVENVQSVWAPWYALHKIMAGLLDVYQHCGNTQALDVLVKNADWVKFRIDRLGTTQVQAMLGNEFGGMNEVLANLYAVTGNPDHLRLAMAFDHKVVFDPLALRQDALTGLHANTQIPKMIGAAREYEMTGLSRYAEIATFFWQRVALHRSYVIGGHSDSEFFFAITEFPLHLTTATCETCNTYNMLKLTRHLFEWSPDEQFISFYERALYNHILASQEPQQGQVTYFMSLKPGHFKTYSTAENAFWCCRNTGMENHSKYGDTIYHHDNNAIYVNLFIGSEVNWRAKGLTLRQETAFPESDTIRLTLRCTNPVPATLKLRYPSWAAAGMTLAINGAAQCVTGAPGSYVPLTRTWQNGDQVEVHLPLTLRTEELPGDQNTVALLCGPVLLAGALGTNGMPASQLANGQGDFFGVPDPVVPVLVCDTRGLVSHTVPVPGQPLTFQTTGVGQPRDLQLVPFYKLHYQRYSVYWKLYSADGWQQQAAALIRADAREVDSVAIANSTSETAHNLQSLNGRTGSFSGLRWRDANNGGWFSYRFIVLSNQPMSLSCTYWGSDSGSRVFDIVVDGTIIATQTLNNNAPGQFFDVEYAIPENLTSNKTQVTVTFQAHTGNIAGGVFGCRMLTTADPGTLQAIEMTVLSPQPVGGRQTPQISATYQTATNWPLTGSSYLVLSSSDPSTLMATDTGDLLGMKPGTATITATYFGKSVSRTVTVIEPQTTLEHRYTFSTTNLVLATNVVDRLNPTNPAFYAVLRGQAIVSGAQLVLNGASGTYADLPPGIISNYHAVTVEAWASFGTEPSWAYLFAFGDTLSGGGGVHGFWYTPHSGASDHRLIVSDVAGHEFLITQSGVQDNQGLKHIVAVLDLDYGYAGLYVDGVLVGERNDVSFTSAAIYNVHSYIGKSTFTWDLPLKGDINEVRIYRGHMSASDVAASYARGPGLVPAKLQAAASPDRLAVQVSWSAAAGTGLETAANLGTEAVWSLVSLAPELVNDRWQLTLPPSNTTAFFRLKQ